jgi:hypothetical protein
MWIESQDKTELIDANRIQLDRTSIYAITSDEEHSGVQLGVYKDNESAVKVLDNMKKRITVIERLKLASLTRTIALNEYESSIFIYEMPQEEVKTDGIN